MSKPDFNVFVGSQTGFFKGINLNKNTVISKNFGSGRGLEKGNQITAMSWNDSSTDEIVVGFQNQKIALFDTQCNCFSWSHAQPVGDGSLVSVFKNSESIITGVDSGEVSILQHRQSTIINTFARDYSDRNTKKPTLCSVKPDLLNTSQFATGGCENDLAIWDMNNSASPLFRAKNIKADMLQLRVPIWITDLTYLPNSSLIAISSRHKHVRLYDPKAQRRPVIGFEWENDPLTCIAPVPWAEKQIIVGTSLGRMALFDLRQATRKTPVYVYKGFIGAVRSVVVNETLPLVFSVSLDRFLRVHNMQNGRIIYKHFLKSRPNCLLVRNDLEREDFELCQKKRPVKAKKGQTKPIKRKGKRST